MDIDDASLCKTRPLQAFAQMLRHGHNPTSTTFTAALSTCRHAGLVKKGWDIFRSIFANGLMPTTEHHDILVHMARAREAMEVVAAMPPDTRGQELEF
jgi:pentatricopeptide repeat protein